jgi:hypothetical protein
MDFYEIARVIRKPFQVSQRTTPDFLEWTRLSKSPRDLCDYGAGIVQISIRYDAKAVAMDGTLGETFMGVASIDDSGWTAHFPGNVSAPPSGSVQRWRFRTQF